MDTVSVPQFLEGPSDVRGGPVGPQAAAAVRARIDWTFMVALELTDPGVDHYVFSEFRDRPVTGLRPQHLLDGVLERLREAGPPKRPRASAAPPMSRPRRATAEPAGVGLRASAGGFERSGRSGSAMAGREVPADWTPPMPRPG